MQTTPLGLESERRLAPPLTGMLMALQLGSWSAVIMHEITSWPPPPPPRVIEYNLRKDVYVRPYGTGHVTGLRDLQVPQSTEKRFVMLTG